jgi:hypothetical protein
MAHGILRLEQQFTGATGMLNGGFGMLNGQTVSAVDSYGQLAEFGSDGHDGVVLGHEGLVVEPLRNGFRRV